MKSINVFLVCGVLVFLSGCEKDQPDKVEAVVSVLECEPGNSFDKSDDAKAVVVATAPVMGPPPEGHVSIAFKSKGEVLATGSAKLHQQLGSIGSSDPDYISVYKAEVNSGERLESLDECEVSKYTSDSGEAVRFTVKPFSQ
ncbi:hypothetical protein EVC62_07795 [Salinicola endophyticus]|uniref:Lipoprotein n=1 Tax=Salinicola endophyticus TaxID=1949083 RepID=A0ABY8FF20_9GAMM|nr:hypothetical protein [Salinicola endophyticus]WFF41417.1 hypothetical protein EVC62_07795 [Salinicola endophyticus]